MLGLGLSIPEIAIRGGGNRFVFTGSAIVPENTATSSSLGTFSVSGGSGTYTYTITAGNGAGKFSISTATLVLAGALDYETTTSYALAITADNGTPAQLLTLHLTLNVGNIAEIPVNLTVPVITGANNSGATLTTSTGTWTDQGGATYTYRWFADAVAIGGATSSTFLLTDTQIGAVITSGVKAINTAGTSSEAVSLGTSAILAAPDVTAPTITSTSTATVNENAALSKSLTADETVTWSIVGGADQAKFEISGSTLRFTSNGTKDYEAPDDANTDDAYIVTVRATDASGNHSDQTVTITVADVVGPSISSVALTSSAGADNTYKAGDVVQATVTFGASVTVTGTPQLTAAVGVNNRTMDYASGSGSAALVFAYTVQAGDTDTNGIAFGANALALNSGTIKAGAENAVLTHSSVADNASHKVDTTAPTLSLPTDVKTGSTTADIGATTNEANGTLFVVASTSATPPTGAQIIAGQMHTGSAAAANASATVSSTGANTVGVTGLTGSTAYFGHSVHRDATGNVSNVVSGDGFTTDAGASADSFNSLDKSGITLTNGDLTATYASTTNAQVRSHNSHSTGKYHFELVVNALTSVGFPVVGIASASHVFTNYCGQDLNSVGFSDGHLCYLNGGATAIAGTSGDLLPTISIGDHIAVEPDLDNKFLYVQNFTTHPGEWNRTGGLGTPMDISTMTNAPFFICVNLKTAGDQVTIITDPAAFLVTPTAGHGAW